MVEDRTGERARRLDGPGTVRRRGLIAGAAALAAGLLAKQTAQPVAAATALQFADTLGAQTVNTAADQTNLVGALPQNTTLFNANANASTNDVIGLIGQGGGIAGVGVMGLMKGVTYPGAGLQSGVYGEAVTGHGIQGVSASSDGVYGSSNTSFAVRGISMSDHGILGSSFSASFGSGKAGVYGYGFGSGNFGVIGDASYSSTTPGAVGVQGQNAQFGVVGTVNNAANTIAVFGNNQSTGANGIGVYGISTGGTGVYGQTSASNQYGILGTTYAANSTAIAGTCTQSGASAFSGGTTNPNAYAGVFQGNVVIQGRLVVSDPSYKSGALAHPDGSHRLVYCVESPESWIEDVGKGTLTSGKATVAFDKDFAAVTRTDDYHVFLTEYGGNNGLYVDKRGTTGFEVHAERSGANSAFSWKVMVKAKSGIKSERLGTFTMPNLPLPDPSKVKAPNIPAAPAPKRA